MDTYFFAKLFGSFSLVVCLGRLFNLDHMKSVVKEVQHSAIGRGIMGWVPLFFGLFILVGNSDAWQHDWNRWTAILLVYALMLTALGVFRLWFVKPWVMVFNRYADFIPVLNCLFGMIFGLLLLYVGFIVPLHS